MLESSSLEEFFFQSNEIVLLVEFLMSSARKLHTGVAGLVCGCAMPGRSKEVLQFAGNCASEFHLWKLLSFRICILRHCYLLLLNVMHPFACNVKHRLVPDAQCMTMSKAIHVLGRLWTDFVF